jgi:hypothetical protein
MPLPVVAVVVPHEAARGDDEDVDGVERGEHLSGACRRSANPTALRPPAGILAR